MFKVLKCSLPPTILAIFSSPSDNHDQNHHFNAGDINDDDDDLDDDDDDDDDDWDDDDDDNMQPSAAVTEKQFCSCHCSLLSGSQGAIIILIIISRCHYDFDC